MFIVYIVASRRFLSFYSLNVLKTPLIHNFVIEKK